MEKNRAYKYRFYPDAEQEVSSVPLQQCLRHQQRAFRFGRELPVQCKCV
ncbi:helix-turn-helix domain-containing protein [Methylomarinum roseum]